MASPTPSPSPSPDPQPTPPNLAAVRIRLVQVAATQLCGANIRVNAICPGLIETGMPKGIYDMARAAGKEERIGHRNPLKRGGQLVSKMRFVVSPSSRSEE